jgi:hypothetical protein
MKKLTTLAALLAVSLVVGCAATKVKETWKRPGYTGKVHKVYLIGVTRNDKLRKIFEDTLANQLKAQGVTGIPSYPDLVISGNVDRETLRAKLRAQGTDAVLVARMAGKEQRTAAYSAGESGYGIGTAPINAYYEEYYNDSVAVAVGVVAAGPAVVNDFNVVSIKANLFDTETAEVAWSALTETTAGYDNREQRLRDFAAILAQKLKEDGLL